MASTTRRVGIIGVGFGSQVHAPAFQSEGWDVAAICSRNRDKAAAAARVLGVSDTHTDPLDLIRRDDLDAIAIASPPASHHDLVLAALAAGKHVLCEKPFALDVRQAVEMRDAAAASHRTCMVAHEFRHTPQRAYIKDLLADGYVGKVEMCTVELVLDRFLTAEPRPVTWAAYKAEGGGILGALGSHYIDALRHWFGDIASVTGQLATFKPALREATSGRIISSETDDSFVFNLRFRDGGIASMNASFVVTPARRTRIVIMGDEGTLMAEHAGPNPPEDGTVVGSRLGAPLQELAMPERYTPLRDARDHRLAAFRLLVRDFTRGVEQGSSPSPNFDDGLRVQEILDAVRESSQSGRRVDIA